MIVQLVGGSAASLFNIVKVKPSLRKKNHLIVMITIINAQTFTHPALLQKINQMTNNELIMCNIPC